MQLYYMRYPDGTEPPVDPGVNTYRLSGSVSLPALQASSFISPTIGARVVAQLPALTGSGTADSKIIPQAVESVSSASDTVSISVAANSTIVVFARKHTTGTAPANAPDFTTPNGGVITGTNQSVRVAFRKVTAAGTYSCGPFTGATRVFAVEVTNAGDPILVKSTSGSTTAVTFPQFTDAEVPHGSLMLGHIRHSDTSAIPTDSVVVQNATDVIYKATDRTLWLPDGITASTTFNWMTEVVVFPVGGTFKASGGTITNQNDYNIHTYTGNSTFTITSGAREVFWEIVGAGASGGVGRGGGGGAGAIEIGSAILGPGVYSVTVGAGGAALSATGDGNNGGNSVFNGVTANGGGGGSGVLGTPGKTGGSGGGGRGHADTPTAGGTAIGSNTNIGGNGSTGADVSFQNGGGGGGAGSAGTNAGTGSAGVGGNGKLSVVPGSSLILSGGGGGCRNLTTGAGGLGGDAGATGGRGSGGLNGGLGTGAPTAGITPGSGGGGGPPSGTGSTSISGAGANGLVSIWYSKSGDDVVEEEVADVFVTSAATLTTALNNAPTNLNRAYIIECAAGDYGEFTYPSNYSRGSTVVRIRGQRSAPPVFREISARGSRNVQFVGIRIIGNSLDRFGFPDTQIGLDLRNARGIAPNYILIQDVVIDNIYHGAQLNSTQRAKMLYCTITGCCNDSLRLASVDDNTPTRDIEIGWCYFSSLSPTFTYPNQSSYMGYTIPTNQAIDTRRSDQRGGTTSVPDLSGVQVTVTAAQKDARHPDRIQSSRQLINIDIHDCEIYNDDCYAQSMFFQGWLAGVWEIPYSTGITIERCLISSSHVHGITFAGCIDPEVTDTMIRRISGINWSSGNVTRPGIGSKELDSGGLAPSSRVICTNVVCPSSVDNGAGGWMNMNKINQVTPIVFSDVAVPTGWAGFDVALNKHGSYGYLNV